MVKLATWEHFIRTRKFENKGHAMHRLGVGAEALGVANRMRARAHNPGTKARVAVLSALVAQRDYNSEYCFQSFDELAEKTGLQRRAVRLAARQLARDRLASFSNGLWSDDGKVAGSGYAATMLGATVFKILTPE